MAPNATSAWSNSGRRCPAAFALSPEPHSSARYAATSPPPPNTATTSSTPSSCSPRANPGYPQFSNLTSYPMANYQAPRCPDLSVISERCHELATRNKLELSSRPQPEPDQLKPATHGDSYHLLM